MIRCVFLLAAVGLAVLAPRAAADVEYVPDEVIVRYAPDADRGARAASRQRTGLGAPDALTARTQVLKIRDGESVAATIAQLRRRPGVLSATPNYIARIALIPNDPGATGSPPGGWQGVQWNFQAAVGVNAPAAWDNLIAAQRPGGRGVTIAVLDTGVAYASRGRFRRSPDLSSSRFRRGYDFVDDDDQPNDHNGHGTHVASTIAESVNNGVGLTGLAYGARIMPVRVLDRAGEGDSVAISKGVRFAARAGAEIINLSFEFGDTIGAADIPDILAALRYARDKGALVVGASGNAAARTVAFPARSSSVVAVGATTEHGCVADYSNNGSGLDLVAPGGGPDTPLAGDPNCRPLEQEGRDIFQMTFSGDVRAFGLPSGYVGTSMAAPHVSATAALVIASGVLGPRPSPGRIVERLKATARDLGPAGIDGHYGSGIVDAAAATAPPA